MIRSVSSFICILALFFVENLNGRTSFAHFLLPTFCHNRNHLADPPVVSAQLCGLLLRCHVPFRIDTCVSQTSSEDALVVNAVDTTIDHRARTPPISARPKMPVAIEARRDTPLIDKDRCATNSIIRKWPAA